MKVYVCELSTVLRTVDARAPARPPSEHWTRPHLERPGHNATRADARLRVSHVHPACRVGQRVKGLLSCKLTMLNLTTTTARRPRATTDAAYTVLRPRLRVALHIAPSIALPPRCAPHCPIHCPPSTLRSTVPSTNLPTHPTQPPTHPPNQPTQPLNHPRPLHAPVQRPGLEVVQLATCHHLVNADAQDLHVPGAGHGCRGQQQQLWAALGTLARACVAPLPPSTPQRPPHHPSPSDSTLHCSPANLGFGILTTTPNHPPLFASPPSRPRLRPQPCCSPRWRCTPPRWCASAWAAARPAACGCGGGAAAQVCTGQGREGWRERSGGSCGVCRVRQVGLLGHAPLQGPQASLLHMRPATEHQCSRTGNSARIIHSACHTCPTSAHPPT